MKRLALPPLVGGIKNGEITWEKIESVDHETLGYLLSCHLIIEHYVTESLKSANWRGDELQWDAGRLSFSQKVAMLPRVDTDKFHDLVPCIKHLNSLRNKFSHNISFQLSDTDLSPFVRFLKEISPAPEKLPDGVTEILDVFTAVACAYFAGFITARAKTFKASRE